MDEDQRRLLRVAPLHVVDLQSVHRHELVGGVGQRRSAGGRRWRGRPTARLRSGRCRPPFDGQHGEPGQAGHRGGDRRQATNDGTGHRGLLAGADPAADTAIRLLRGLRRQFQNASAHRLPGPVGHRHRANPMRLAVPHVQGAAPVDEHAVGAGQAHRRGSGSGPSPRWPVPSTVPMTPVRRSIPRMMWLSVSATYSRSRHQASPFGPARRRLPRRAAVAGVALLAGAGDVVDASACGIDAVDRVALAQRQVEVAVGRRRRSCAGR